MLSKPLDGSVAVRFFMPSPALAPYISTYYLTEVHLPAGEFIEDWLHPEWANLRFVSGGAWSSVLGEGPLEPMPQAILTGPTSLAAHFRLGGGARAWGVGILPLGWLRLLGVPASNHVDKTVALAGDPTGLPLAGLPDAAFAGGDGNAADEAARIDAYLLNLLDRSPPHEDEPKIRAAHAALVDEDMASVADLAERIAMSSRSLERLSLKAFGFSPKLLLRRQRFLRSLAQFMLDPSLTWIRTLDFHYVDQAHFVRDFRRFMAMSPRRYAGIDHPVLRAAAQGRAAAAGAAVQALHRP
ncbi:MAG: helix-turn-helix domain-containing protein [Novosphingobium sp.]